MIVSREMVKLAVEGNYASEVMVVFTNSVYSVLDEITEINYIKIVSRKVDEGVENYEKLLITEKVISMINLIDYRVAVDHQLIQESKVVTKMGVVN